MLKYPFLKREATVEVHIPTIKRQLIALSCKWLTVYITAEMGITYECNFTKYIASANCAQPSGTNRHLSDFIQPQNPSPTVIITPLSNVLQRNVVTDKDKTLYKL